MFATEFAGDCFLARSVFLVFFGVYKKFATDDVNPLSSGRGTG